MNTKTLVLLAVGGIVVYFLFLAPKPKPQGGVSNIVTDLGKLIGDFSGSANA